MSAATDYFDIAMEHLQRFHATQALNVDAAAKICADSIANNGLVFVFGSGHSRFMCDEMTPRQGGLIGFFALVELALSNHTAIVGSNGLRVPLSLEKYQGLAEEILKSFKFGPNDSFILVSTKRHPTPHRRNGYGGSDERDESDCSGFPSAFGTVLSKPSLR